MKLIDELGGEENAVAWLETEKKIGSGLEIVDWKPKSNTDPTVFGFTIATIREAPTDRRCSVFRD